METNDNKPPSELAQTVAGILIDYARERGIPLDDAVDEFKAALREIARKARQEREDRQDEEGD